MAAAIPPSFIGTAWLNTVLMGFESLLLCGQETFLDSATGQTIGSRTVALTHATQLMKLCSDWMLCDVDELSQAAFAAVSKLCSGALTTSESGECYLDVERHTDTDNWLVKWGDIVSRLLSTGGQNNALWTRAIECLVQLASRTGGRCEKFLELLIRVLPQIAELRDQYEDTDEAAIAALVPDRKHHGRSRTADTLTASERALQSATEAFVGCVIKMYGPSAVARALPLADVALLSSERAWLVPLLKQHTERTELDQFRTLILPVIQHVSQQIDGLSDDVAMDTDAARAGPSPAAVTLGTLRYQLWSCLPSFARGVVPGGLREINETVIEAGTVTRTTGGSLWQLMLELLHPTESTGLEVIVLATVRSLVASAQDQQEMRDVLTSGAMFPQLLQRMFSLYLRDQRSDRAIGAGITATLGVYLPLFEPATFDANVAFLLNQKLGGVARNAPTEAQLRCVDLLLMLAPHATETAIAGIDAFLTAFLSGQPEASAALQKRAYRLLQLITAADTQTSCEYTKANLQSILDRLKAWRDSVKTDSWKCRVKCVYNLFKLLSGPEEVAALLNGFLAEIVGCLGVDNKKARAVAGVLLVEGVLACGDATEQSLAASIDAMLQRVIASLRETMDDHSSQAVQYKEALAKALFLIVSENRLARAVSRKHIVDTMAFVSEMLTRPEQSGNTRHLVKCALDILAGLLKKKTANFDKIYLVDVGQCIAAASCELRMKVRDKVKRILKKMLKLWQYEDIKKVIPADLIPVLRNIHKAMNRSNRNNKDAGKDGESCATSWGGASELASQRTMKNPHIKK